jgi:hypothetical protein
LVAIAVIDDHSPLSVIHHSADWPMHAHRSYTRRLHCGHMVHLPAAMQYPSTRVSLAS